MKVIKPKVIVQRFDADQMKMSIERAGRTCYKSEGKITPTSADSFIHGVIARGHLSVIEHEKLSIRFICDRGITHELVRHRLASFSQESTRYCNYGKDKFGSEITVIDPFFWEDGSEERSQWKVAMEKAEQQYLRLLEIGASAQQARSVLPNSLKTEIVTTANIREWKLIFGLRCASTAHPQIRQLMVPLRFFLLEAGLGVFFEDTPPKNPFPPEHYAEVVWEDENK